LKTVALYDEKERKLVTDNYVEIDLYDLANYGSPIHIEECIKLPSSKVRNKTLLEWFTVDNIPCWWFVCPDIYRKFDEAALFVDQLLSFLEENSPDLIKLCGVYDKLDIIQQICNIKKIQLQVLNPSFSLSSKFQFTKRLTKKLLHKKPTKSPAQKRLNIFSKTKTFKPPTNYALINSVGEYRRTVINEKGETKREEFILQPILEKLKLNGIATLCFDTSFAKNINVLEERLQTNYNWIPIEFFIKKPQRESTKKSIHTLKKSINNLLETNFGNIFDYRNISLSKYMKPHFEAHLVETRLPMYLHLIDQLEEFFKNYPPKILIQLYEYGPRQKAILMAAKKANIQTIAIQHGIIHDHHYDYMHKEIQSETNHSGNPIPDLTLVFGEFYKKVLTLSGNYPEKKVSVIGNPTFYKIDEIKKQLSREKILEKYNLSDKKIILIPADYNFSKSRNNPGRIILNLLEKKLQDDKNLVGLVRPHPVNPFNQSYLDELYPSKIFKCSKGTLLEDILISDVLITNGSTVAIDAALFEKPIIFANVTNDNQARDIQKIMIEKNIAISCSREELVSELESVLKGNIKELGYNLRRQLVQFPVLMYDPGLLFPKSHQNRFL